MGEIQPRFLRLRALAVSLLCCAGTSEAGDELPFGGLSLRFHSPGMESAFLQSTSQRLVSNFVWVGIISSIFSLLHLAWEGAAGKFKCEWYPSDLAHGIEMIGYSSLAFLFLLGIVIVILMRLLQWTSARARVIEVSGLLLLMIGMIACVLMSRFYIARFLGIVDPEAVLGREMSDAWLLLILDLVITISHVYLPIRWCVLWPLEVMAAVCYPTLVFFFGSNHGEVPSINSLQLACLVCFAALGKRSLEEYERRSFYNLIREKTLRAKAEFQLATKENTAASREHESDTTLTSSCADTWSVPSASSTGRLFCNIRVDTVQAKMKALFALGQLEHWLIKTSELEFDPHRILGSGSFGLVVAGLFRGSPVAVKVSRRASTAQELRHIPALLNELRVLRRVRHSNIVLFHGAAIDVASLEIALVMEVVRGENLMKFAVDTRITDYNRYTILEDVCRALHYLHGFTPSILHGDLKPANIMVLNFCPGGVARAKLLDFGLSRVLVGNVQPLGGSLRWLAPEVVRYTKHDYWPNSAADIFSLGRTMHFTVTGNLVFEGMSRRALQQRLRAGRLPRVEWDGSSVLLPLCRDLAELCTAQNPSARPNIKDVHSSLTQWRHVLGTDEHEVSDEDCELRSPRAWVESMQVVRGTPSTPTSRPRTQLQSSEQDALTIRAIHTTLPRLEEEEEEEGCEEQGRHGSTDQSLPQPEQGFETRRALGASPKAVVGTRLAL